MRPLYSIIVFFFLFIVMLLLFYGFSSYTTTIPGTWDKYLVLDYNESSGMVGEHRSYKITSDTLYFKEKKNQQKETAFKLALSQNDLSNLLLILRTNSADKIKLKKYGYILYDGGAFSLQMKYKNDYIFNISNSAYEGLKDADRAPFEKIVAAIKKLKQKNDEGN